MKKILSILLVSSFFVLLFSSCEEDKSLYDGPSLIHFDNSQGAFYVQDTPDSKYEIYIGSTIISNADRTVAVEIDPSSSAVEGVSFNMPNKTITIPAGQSYGILEIEGIYAGTSPEGETLLINIASTNEGEIADFKNSYQLTVYQFCPFDIYDFEGIWTVADLSLYYGASSYEIALEVFDEQSKTMVVTNLWENTPLVYISFDDSNPAKFTCKIADQNYAVHGTYGQMKIVDVVQGTFSACAKIINTSYKIYVTAGNFDVVNPSTWTFKEAFPSKK